MTVNVELPEEVVHAVLKSIGAEEGLIDVPEPMMRTLIQALKKSVGRTTPPDNIDTLGDNPVPEY
jgi:hypothetical protein